MKIETREIYRCEHCGKLYLSKNWCEQHEPKCRANPINSRKCLQGCKYLTGKEVKYIYTGMAMGMNLEVELVEKELTKDILFCSKKKEYIYPFWCKDPILQDDIVGEIPNEEMPKECDKFKLMGIK